VTAAVVAAAVAGWCAGLTTGLLVGTRQARRLRAALDGPPPGRVVHLHHRLRPDTDDDWEDPA